MRALPQPFSSLSCKSLAHFTLADFLAGSLFLNQPAHDVPCMQVQLPTVVIHAAVFRRKTTLAAWMT
jgi:hypothetical protein